MKKIVLSLGLCTAVLAVTAFSTDVEAETTNATVTFTENGGGTTPGQNGLVKPGTPNETIYVPGDEGKSTTGPLRFTNIPHIKFGTVKINAQGAKYDSLMSQYQPAANGQIPAGTVAKVNIPHFVQVADERGTTGQFNVTVAASTFKSGTKELVNTRVELYNATVRNSTLDKVKKDNDASALLEHPGLTNDVAKPIPTATGQSLSVLKVKAGKSANATTSSTIFSKNYTSATDYSKTANNTSVKLYVPQGEQPEKLTYTAVLTWTLADTI